MAAGSGSETGTPEGAAKGAEVASAVGIAIGVAEGRGLSGKTSPLLWVLCALTEAEVGEANSPSERVQEVKSRRR